MRKANVVIFSKVISLFGIFFVFNPRGDEANTGLLSVKWTPFRAYTSALLTGHF